METKKPKISSQSVEVDVAGMKTTRWFVRLPEGLVADDLKDPALWSVVVAQRLKVIKKHDVVYAVGFADDFAVEARVVGVSGDGIALGKLSIINFPAPTKPLYSDDLYAIAWVGNGYGVIRKSDKMQMGPVFATEQKAIMHLQNQYPQDAA